MAAIYHNLTALIGKTPLLELHNIEQSEELAARLIVKLESFNPGGSVKDRIALEMIEQAEAKGILTPGAVIIEPTSGNTGIGLAWVASVKGYKLILTMPETMSVERQNLLKALGATLVLTPGSEGMKGAIRKANELQELSPNSVILQQFENPANPAVHLRTTTEEIWSDTDGKVDIFVAGVGTGGTISGTAEGLKAHNPEIQAIAVEPDSSPVLSGEQPGPHKIQGIGAGFIPKNFNPDVVDGIIRVKDDDAIRTSRLLAQKEGLLVGISSGAAAYAAIQLAKKTGKQRKNNCSPSAGYRRKVSVNCAVRFRRISTLTENERTTMSTGIKFIIADNQDITRAGLHGFISGSFDKHVVMDVRNKKELISTLIESGNSVVILDYTLFDLNGVEELLIIQKRFPQANWILFPTNSARRSSIG